MSYLIILNYIYINFLIQTSNTKYVNFLVVAFSIFITFFIAFRYEVGGDWFTYRINYDSIADKNLFYSLKAYSSKIVVLIIYYTNSSVIPNISLNISKITPTSKLISKAPYPKIRTMDLIKLIIWCFFAFG